jgi:hypothetical protein
VTPKTLNVKGFKGPVTEQTQAQARRALKLALGLPMNAPINKHGK